MKWKKVIFPLILQLYTFFIKNKHDNIGPWEVTYSSASKTLASAPPAFDEKSLLFLSLVGGRYGPICPRSPISFLTLSTPWGQQELKLLSHSVHSYGTFTTYTQENARYFTDNNSSSISLMWKLNIMTATCDSARKAPVFPSFPPPLDTVSADSLAVLAASSMPSLILFPMSERPTSSKPWGETHRISS